MFNCIRWLFDGILCIRNTHSHSYSLIQMKKYFQKLYHFELWFWNSCVLTIEFYYFFFVLLDGGKVLLASFLMPWQSFYSIFMMKTLCFSWIRRLHLLWNELVQQHVCECKSVCVLSGCTGSWLNLFFIYLHTINFIQFIIWQTVTQSILNSISTRPLGNNFFFNWFEMNRVMRGFFFVWWAIFRLEKNCEYIFWFFFLHRNHWSFVSVAKIIE